MNVSSLMFVLIYIFAVIGVGLFAPVKWNGPLEARLNFSNIFEASLTLFETATNESWGGLIDALGIKNTHDYSCKVNASYEDYLAAGKKPVSCGDYGTAYIFFGAYLLIMTLGFLNLFIAIILNGYNETRDRHAL